MSSPSAAPALRVILVGNYLPDRQVSMQKFGELMAAGLRERGLAVELVRPQPFLSKLAFGRRGAAKWLGYLDKFVLFPLQLRRRLHRIPAGERARTVVHICDHSNSPYVAHLRRWRQVVTCHDLIAIQQADGRSPGPAVGWTGRIFQRWIARHLRRARWIACVSNNTRRDLGNFTGRTDATVRTILSQLNESFAPLDPAAAWPLLAPALAPAAGVLVLHVGNNAWYKNRDGVLRIFARACALAPGTPARLVVVGPEFSPAQQETITRLGLGARVHRIAGLSSAQLQAAYSVADAFLFPSLYEGFGWPPVEAQACGCAVVAGTGGSLAEVLADSALTADARDEERLAGFLAQLLQDPAARAELKRRGAANVGRFLPPRMIDEYAALYEGMLAAAAGPAADLPPR